MSHRGASSSTRPYRRRAGEEGGGGPDAKERRLVGEQRRTLGFGLPSSNGHRTYKRGRGGGWPADGKAVFPGCRGSNEHTTTYTLITAGYKSTSPPVLSIVGFKSTVMIMHITAGSLPDSIGLTRNIKKMGCRAAAPHASTPWRTPPPGAPPRWPLHALLLARLTHRCKLEEAKGEETTDWSYQSTD